jgi:hypothetical protein
VPGGWLPAPRQSLTRPLKKSGLMLNGKWQMVMQWGFAIFHLRFAIQDAFSSILLCITQGNERIDPGRAPGGRRTSIASVRGLGQEVEQERVRYVRLLERQRAGQR